jgi:hypothetical protein
VAWDAAHGFKRVATAPRVARTTVEEILENPSRYLGHTVEVVGVFMDWSGGHGPPPVTRSDWLLAGKTGKTIYVKGAPPLPPNAKGKATLRVIGMVKQAPDGRPYIDPISVTLIAYR